MNTKELLLNNRWILKSEDRESYYKIKDEAKELRKLFNDKLGYSLIANPLFYRLDKIPAKAEPWMGINEFTTVTEYLMFIYILVYLEDKEIEKQFILTDLIEFIQIQLKQDQSYWLERNNRRRLVNVLNYCINEKLIIQNEGNSDNFTTNLQEEVLFENTGLSRYFMRTFTSDVFEWQDIHDIMNDSLFEDIDTSKGDIRTNRIYRRLLLSMGIYKDNEEKDQDYDYLIKQRKSIENNLNHIVPCDLQVYKSSAYMILEDEVSIGNTFPKANALDELVVLCNTYLKQYALEYQLIDEYEMIHIQYNAMIDMINKVVSQNKVYLTKGLLTKANLEEEVLNYMINIGLGTRNNDEIIFFPIIGKLEGKYGEVKA